MSYSYKEIMKNWDAGDRHKLMDDLVEKFGGNAQSVLDSITSYMGDAEVIEMYKYICRMNGIYLEEPEDD